MYNADKIERANKGENMKKSILALSTLTFVLALSLFSSTSLSIGVPKIHVKYVSSWQSLNWAGYVVETSLSSPQNGSVSDVHGSWWVPSSANGPKDSLVGCWVGIDGYNYSTNNPTVEQTGTASVIDTYGVQTYYAWYEMVPLPAVNLPYTVLPGDWMSAEVRYVGSGVFYLNIFDATQGWNFSTSQTQSSALRNSAEWIVEGPAPFFGPITPSGIPPQTQLTNFGTVQWISCLATLNGVTGSIGSTSWQNNEITMIDSHSKIIAQPTPLFLGATRFNVTTCIVTISPTSVTMDVGQSRTFTSSVKGGTAPYSYQWYLNGVAVSGATSSSWTFTPSYAGSYTVNLIVKDAAGDVGTSKTASVTVNAAPSVSISPTSVTMRLGQSQTFTSSATAGTPPYSYQWYLNGVAVSGATSSSWTFTPSYAGSYTVKVVVTDAVSGVATSNTASVTVTGGGSGCVLQNTRILLANGKAMPVQALKPGDEIIGYDVQTGTFVTETITSNNCTTVFEILSINNGLLYLTPTDQPIYTDHGWIKDPQDLRTGWKIYDPAKNAWITISSLGTSKGHFQVYDLRTTKPDTFIGNGILLDTKTP